MRISRSSPCNRFHPLGDSQQPVLFRPGSQNFCPRQPSTLNPLKKLRNGSQGEKGSVGPMGGGRINGIAHAVGSCFVSGAHVKQLLYGSPQSTGTQCGCASC